MDVDDEGCCRSAGSRAKVVIDDEGYRAAPPAAEPRWSSGVSLPCRRPSRAAEVVIGDEGCCRSTSCRAEVVVDDEGCCRSAAGRAEVIVEDEGAAAPLAAETKWSRNTQQIDKETPSTEGSGHRIAPPVGDPLSPARSAASSSRVHVVAQVGWDSCSSGARIFSCMAL